MRVDVLAALGALALLGCGSSQTGSEDAGETTVASGSSDSESTTQAAEETGEPMDCGSVTLQATYVPPIVMFVVDTSASMLAQWDHDGDPNTPTQSRWASARELIGLISETLVHHPQYGHLPVLGVQRFPSADACPSATPMMPSCADASACAVAMAPEVSLAQQDAVPLLAALPGPSPEPLEFPGGSPAAAAYASAVAHIVDAPFEETWSYVVLLTDGRTNCGADLEAPDNFAVYDSSLHSLVEDALAEHNIQTIVVAIDEAADPALETGLDQIPGYDPRPALNELAQAGGLAAGYFSASDLEQIAMALEGPDESPICYIELVYTQAGLPTPEQIPLVTWTINGEPVPYVEPDACATQNGWTWIVGDDLPPGEIVTFCGQACEAMKTSGALIEGEYGCPPAG
jgi:hypothetical protein